MREELLQGMREGRYDALVAASVELFGLPVKIVVGRTTHVMRRQAKTEGFSPVRRNGRIVAYCREVVTPKYRELSTPEEVMSYEGHVDLLTKMAKERSQGKAWRRLIAEYTSAMKEEVKVASGSEVVQESSQDSQEVFAGQSNE